MGIDKIILWSGWVITTISFLVNILQYFRFKEIDYKYKEITKNAIVLLEGIKNSLTYSVDTIEKSSPPLQAEIALSSLKGAVKSVTAGIVTWLTNYGFAENQKRENFSNKADAKSRAAD